MNKLVTIVAAGLAWGAVTIANAAVAKGEDPNQNAKLAREWAAIANLPNFWEGTWQEISGLYEFPGPVEYTPEVARYVKNAKSPADTVMANCKMPGMPFVMYQGAMPIKFFASPGLIALYIETYAVTRFFHTDGRRPPEDPNPTYLGTSVAHWEGDTLVVDSRGFVPDTLLQIGALPPIPGGQSGFDLPLFKEHGPALRFVERMRLTDYNTLEIATTVHDDTIFAKPYTSKRIWHRYTGPRSEPQEWVCSDNRDFYDEQSDTLHYNEREKAISTSKGAAEEKQ